MPADFLYISSRGLFAVPYSLLDEICRVFRTSVIVKFHRNQLL